MVNAPESLHQYTTPVGKWAEFWCKKKSHDRINQSAAHFHKRHFFLHSDQKSSQRAGHVLRRMIISSVPNPSNALIAGSGTDETVYRLAAVPKVVPEASVAAS